MIKEILTEKFPNPGSLGISISCFYQLTNGKFLIGFDDQMSKKRFDKIAKSIEDIKVENPRRKRPVIMLQGLPENFDTKILAQTIMEFNVTSNSLLRYNPYFLLTFSLKHDFFVYFD